MIEEPRVLRSIMVHEGWLKLRTDVLQIEGVQSTYPYDVVTMGDGVAVLPFLDEGTLLLAKQYRHPVKDYLLELIQGGISKGETREEAARRELLEETGYGGALTHMITMYPMPTSLDMRLHVMRCTELEWICEPQLDETERLRLVKRDYSEVLEEVIAGKHKDSALVMAVLYHEAQRNSGR